MQRRPCRNSLQTGHSHKSAQTPCNMTTVVRTANVPPCESMRAQFESEIHTQPLRMLTLWLAWVKCTPAAIIRHSLGFASVRLAPLWGHKKY